MLVGSVRVCIVGGNITFVEVNTRKKEPGGRWREINNVCHKKKDGEKTCGALVVFRPRPPVVYSHAHIRARERPRTLRTQ